MWGWPLWLLVVQLLMSGLSPEQHSAVHQQRKSLKNVFCKVQITTRSNVTGVVRAQVTANIMSEPLRFTDLHKISLWTTIPWTTRCRSRLFGHNGCPIWTSTSAMIEQTQTSSGGFYKILAKCFIITAAAHADIWNWSGNLTMVLWCVSRNWGKATNKVGGMACQVVDKNGSIAESGGKNLVGISARVLSCPP